MSEIIQEKKVRMIDTEEYVSVLRDLVNEGSEVSMRIAGNSMSPLLIHNRDMIVFSAPKRSLQRGDIVFYQRNNGQFVCHRIYKITADGLYMVGDAQTVIEGPLPEKQVFAVITKICRKGTWLEPGDRTWDFFEKIWIRIIPLRRPMIRLYGWIHGNKRK